MVRAFGFIKDLLCRFASDGRGNYAVIFALALTPILIAIGAAIDYSAAIAAKSKLGHAADAAALAGVAYQATMPSASVARTLATDMFNGVLNDFNAVTSKSVTTTVTDTAAGRTVVVAYEAVMPTTFMGIARINTMTLKGSSTAAAGLPTYIDFYMLLDNSPSMGIGATTADIAKMVNNTSDKCAFACHDKSTTNNYYNKAKSLGVTMRIDVVRTATQSLMDTAAQTAAVANQFRVAIYSFGASATNIGLTNLAPLTANLATAKSQASALDLMTVPAPDYNNDQHTPYDTILPAMNAAIPAPGTGAANSTPQKVLFFVSDGVADQYLPSGCTRPTTNGRCQEPITVSLCKAIKDRGIKIAVLYTTYQPLPTNSWYNTWIGPFAGNIGTLMQSCASPGLYFEVSPTQGIESAMTALFQRAVGSARITN
jgi:Flp pilus assembly protein TadG